MNDKGEDNGVCIKRYTNHAKGYVYTLCALRLRRCTVLSALLHP